MMKKLFMFILLFVAMATMISAVQPTQQYNKLLLSPFYVNSMTQNVWYNYSVNVSTPDGISVVKSAILTLDAWINPTRTFNAWMNGVQCNTKNYTISTTYASAGRGVVTFDCTNAVLPNQLNTVRYVVTGGNIGSSTAWLDLTYMNNPQGDLTIHGTEYVFGQTSKSWLQLLDNNLTYVNNGVCFVDIYYPDHTEFVERATMTNSLHDGIYYYDIIPPNIEGVYPVIAECFYQASQTYNNVTSFSISNGTLDTGDFTRTYVEDGIYMGTTETPAGAGNPRRYRAEFNFTNSTCTNVSQLLFQGITIGGTFRWNSNPTTDDMNIYIYNWSNASWVLLPNQIPAGGTGAKTVSNTLSFNNITNAGYVNNSANRPLRLKFEDNNITDTSSSGMDYDYLYVSCNQLSSPAWQDVKGSSELHVTNPLGYRFIPETLCNGDYPDSPDCAYFSTEGNHSPEGIIIENITLSNPLGTEISQPYIYTTASGIDCTAIDLIDFIKGNVTTDLTDTTIYSLGDSDNCVMGIPVEFFNGETMATIHIHMDNYIKWEVLRANDIRQGATILADTCNKLATQYNFTYITPLNTTAQTLTNNTDLIYCSRVMDDLWYFDTVYNESLNISVVGEYESYYYEIAQFYLPLIEQEYLVISAGLQNMNQLSIIGLLNNTPLLVWNFTTRNLTYYQNFTVSQVDLTNYSRVSNLTASDVWSFTTRNLTYYPPMSADINYTLITQSVWSYAGNISQVIGDYIGFNTWNYSAKYVHGVLIS